MVHDHIIREIEYRSVHGEIAFLSIIGFLPSGRIECSAVTERVPFVFGQMPIIIRVNDGVFSPG